jgi:hypothetical protein
LAEQAVIAGLVLPISRDKSLLGLYIDLPLNVCGTTGLISLGLNEFYSSEF